jgi:hypothetical protein
MIEYLNCPVMTNACTLSPCSLDSESSNAGAVPISKPPTRRTRKPTVMKTKRPQVMKTQRPQTMKTTQPITYVESGM